METVAWSLLFVSSSLLLAVLYLWGKWRDTVSLLESSRSGYSGLLMQHAENSDLLDKMTAKHEQLCVKLDEKSKELSSCKGKLSRRDKRIESLSDEVEFLSGQCDDNEKLRRRVKELENLTGVLKYRSDMVQENEEVRRNHLLKLEECEQIRSELEAVKSKLRKANSELESLRSVSESVS